MRSRFSFALVCLLSLVAVPLTAAAETLLPSLSPVLKRVSPAVVNIATTAPAAENPLFLDPFFRRFFDVPDLPVERETRSVGSGVIIDADKGFVVTNAHVVENARKITVVLNDRRELAAEVVGTDPETDIAILRIPARNLVALPFPDSPAPVSVGDFVVAIGNPFGLGQTATLGIVSAIGRSGLGIEGYEDFIQTDASINPGNSGGALINMEGRFVGINTAILSRSGGNIGIGFAIPTRMARLVAEQLIAHGEVRRGQLGIMIQDLTPDLARAMGVDRSTGAVVSRVMPGSAAEKAGLKAGDVIVGVDGRPIRTGAELRNTIGLTKPGTPIELDLLRDGQRQTASATLDRRTPRDEARRQFGGSDGSPLAGVQLAPIPPDHPLATQLDGGVLVVDLDPKSEAAQDGLLRGDVIISVNRRPVRSPDDVRAAVRSKDGAPVLLNIRRGDGAIFLAIG